MATYNYSEISGFEFESLCRDLLQADLGLTLELFAPGPDSGIDIRFVGRANGERRDLVAQCKRWADGSYRDLLRHLTRVELPKIKALAPSRYILMTSVGLSPAQKDKIVNALQPWIRSPSDVFGKDDISGLLARHPEVERRHIKLWLTSTEVLRALLNSDIAVRSEGAVEEARNQLRLWVPNKSFRRAHEILEDSHVCVISGMPGVGKSMLANILLAAYVSKGYQPIVISSDINEGERAWSSRDRQIFHYDDFLGQISYGELNLDKNEESRLTRFMLMVTRNRHKRFILTTREYILSEAVNRYDQFSSDQLAHYKSFVSLSDYTEIIRAKILYNHLFFSDLSPELKRSLIPGRKYWDVIRHRHYNPRVLSHAVQFAGVGNSTPDDFVSRMLATLDSPSEVWDSIFINLPSIAQRFLMALASLPSEVLLDDVRAVVEELCGRRLDLGEFRGALTLLEGTFIALRRTDRRSHSSERLVEIRDASVLDYLWGLLKEDVGEADSLLKCAVFFEQCVVLHNREPRELGVFAGSGYGVRADAERSVNVDVGLLATKALELIHSTNPRLSRWMDNGHVYLRRDSASLEYRSAFLVGLLSGNRSNRSVASVVSTALEACLLKWEKGRGSPKECVYLIRQAKQVKDALPEEMFARLERAVIDFVASRLHQTGDFAVLVELSILIPELFNPPHRSIDSWQTEFREFLEDEKAWLLGDFDDPDGIEYEVTEIQKVAEAFDEDVTDLVLAAERRVRELRDYDDYEPDEDTLRELYADEHEPPELHSASGLQSAREQIDALFQSLL